MENTYAAEVAVLETEELLNLLQAREEYEPEVILAVIAELEKREVLAPDLEEIKAQVTAEAGVALAARPPAAPGKLAGMLQAFVPQQGYFVTPILLNLNLLVYIGMLLLGIDFMSPEAGQLFAIGGNYGPYTLSGEWWRLFTSMFLHGGLIHLALNMLALVSVGRQLEVMIGRSTFVISYILCGLAGSLTSVWWDGTRVSVGASGAIFGMFGLLLVLMALERKLSWQQKRAMLGNLLFVIVINLGYGMKGGIDNAAHSGGLVAGVMLGAILMFRSGRVIAPNYKLTGNAAMAAGGLLVLAMGYYLVPFSGQVRYLYTIDRVVENDTAALQTMQKLQEAGDKPKAAEFVPLLEEGIKLWDESEVMLEAIDDVSGEEKDRTLVMLDYVRLRKISYQMFRDDLANNRTFLHPKQQQVLYAIEGYANALIKGEESRVVDKRFRNDAAMPEIELIGADSAEVAGGADPVKKALLVIDGEKMGVVSQDSMPDMLSAMDESNIAKVTVLKGEAAIKAYGKEGTDGVIMITTKKGKK